MERLTRRRFLGGSMAAGLAIGGPRAIRGAGGRAGSPNEAVNVAVVGLGSTTAVGGVGGRGHQLIDRLREIPDVNIVALCDVDRQHLDRELAAARDLGEAPAACRDVREILDDRGVDAVVIAMPNHWHALATIWACQAGKDVYVEKPFSYDLWEGRQMVAAARKYGRMVQVGTQRRSSGFLRRVFERLHGGELGPIRFAHALVYRPRPGIARVEAPTDPPPTADYDLWCGPAPKGPLMRSQLHYEWHWFWDTGNGEIGNNGVHVIDIARWGLGQDRIPPRALSLGGRFAADDGAETPNTQIALLDYRPAPLICEVRNVAGGGRPGAIGSFRGLGGGILIDCEGGSFAGDFTGGRLYDRRGELIEDLGTGPGFGPVDRAHLANFLDAVRSRRADDLAAEAIEGHRSTACCHLANVSHRLGAAARPEEIREAISGDAELADAFERCRAYLAENGVDLEETPATLGPWVSYDDERGRFVGDRAAEAEGLSRRSYRAPFVVPEVAEG